jgi:uncharacterized protein (DUF983 family)
MSSRYTTIFGRALRLRCPRCGHGKLFIGWFKMPTECATCGLVYQREPGFFLGSIYFNYGLTALLVIAAYFIGFFSGVHPSVLLWSLTAFCFLFPLWFFRYARSLWLAFDQYWDPRGKES